MNMQIYLPSIRTNGTPSTVCGPEGLGVGMPHQNAEADHTWYDKANDLLSPGWWYNWKSDQIGKPGYVPMLWGMRRDIYYLEAMVRARANTRQFWLMGNEPEEEAQSNVPPEEAALTMRKWEYDTPVLWACPGICLSQKGIDWLDEYIVMEGPVPSVWHVHIYAQSVTDWWLWLRTFSDWMQTKRVVRPIIVSETAIDGRDMGMQLELMTAMKHALSIDRIQAAAWFSATYTNMAWTNLMDGDDLTTLGQHYIDIL